MIDVVYLTIPPRLRWGKSCSRAPKPKLSSTQLCLGPTEFSSNFPNCLRRQIARGFFLFEYGTIGRSRRCTRCSKTWGGSIYGLTNTASTKKRDPKNRRCFKIWITYTRMLKQQSSRCTVKMIGLDFREFSKSLEDRNLVSGQHATALSLPAHPSRH